MNEWSAFTNMFVIFWYSCKKCAKLFSGCIVELKFDKIEENVNYTVKSIRMHKFSYQYQKVKWNHKTAHQHVFRYAIINQSNSRSLVCTIIIFDWAIEISDIFRYFDFSLFIVFINSIVQVWLIFCSNWMDKRVTQVLILQPNNVTMLITNFILIGEFHIRTDFS